MNNHTVSKCGFPTTRFGSSGRLRTGKRGKESKRAFATLTERESHLSFPLSLRSLPQSLRLSPCLGKTVSNPRKRTPRRLAWELCSSVQTVSDALPPLQEGNNFMPHATSRPISTQRTQQLVRFSPRTQTLSRPTIEKPPMQFMYTADIFAVDDIHQSAG